MDKALIVEHLAQAERHVTQGQQHIERQRQIIHELEREGHDAAKARDLLIQFEEMQLLHISDRDRLRAELARDE